MSSIMGIDYGCARIGIAKSDPGRVIALAQGVIAVEADGSHIDRVVNAAKEFSISQIYIGCPISLCGTWGKAAHEAYAFALRIWSESDIPVFMVDERLTTKEAMNIHGRWGQYGRRDKSGARGGNAVHGGRGRCGNAPSGRKVRQKIDSIAASVLLQHVLDCMKAGVVCWKEVREAGKAEIGEVRDSKKNTKKHSVRDTRLDEMPIDA